MKTFSYKLFKFLLPLLIIFLGLGSIYFITDPFKVIYDYPNYSNLPIIPNRDFVSTEMFLKNYKKVKYDSFIFGSSRTMAYKPEEWKNYLNNEAKPFVFDASGETLYGIEKKITFLNELKIPIKNVLLIICPDITLQTTRNSQGHIYIKDPRTSKEGALYFHLQFIQAFFNTNFLKSFLMYKIKNKVEPFMYNYIEERNIQYHPVTNHLVIIDKEKEINTDENKFYNDRKDLFEIQNNQTEYESQIKEPQLKLLKSIHTVLEKHETNYKIIISPLYNKIKFSKEDLKQLEDLFGSKNVYDFSGINQFTLDRTNYYEPSHYRPKLGDKLLRKVYGN